LGDTLGDSFMNRRRAIAIAAVLAISISLIASTLYYWFWFEPGQQQTTVQEYSPQPSGGEYVDVGRVVCFRGDKLTSVLWSKLKAYSASNPVVENYVDWLRAVLSSNPERALNASGISKYWVFDSSEFKPLELPLNTSVRIGLVKLPFGAGLIVSAFEAGDSITVVVHATIINATEWADLLLLTGVFLGKPSNGSVSVEWALWRVGVNASGRSYVEVGGRKLAIKHIAVLFEMPAYYFGDEEGGGDYWWQAESAYWSLVGHSALALALHLANPPLEDSGYSSEEEYALALYNSVYWLANSVVPLKHPGDVVRWSYFTPFLINKHGEGVCNEQARATALFASNALGAVVGYVSIPVLQHALSILKYTTAGSVNLDSDGDGVLDSTVLRDTAKLERAEIEAFRKTVYWFKPLMYTDPDSGTSPYGYLYSTIIYTVLSLPSWLKAPWLLTLLEKTGFPELETEAWSRVAELNPALCGEHIFGSLRGLVNCEHCTRSPSYIVLESVAGSIPWITPPRIGLSRLVKGVVSAERNGGVFKGSAVIGGDNTMLTLIYTARLEPSLTVSVRVNGSSVYACTVKRVYSNAVHLVFGYKGRSYLIAVKPADVSAAELPLVWWGLMDANISITAYWQFDLSRYVGVRRIQSSNITVEVFYDVSKASWRAHLSIDGYREVFDLGPEVSSPLVIKTTWRGMSLTINVTLASGPTETVIVPVVLNPEYTVVNHSDLGGVLVFSQWSYRGFVSVGGARVEIAVSARLARLEEYVSVPIYSLAIYVNNTLVLLDNRAVLPRTYTWVSDDGRLYVFDISTATPPSLNLSHFAELTESTSTPVQLPNGTVLYVTVYRVSEVLKLGGVTLYVHGYVSRLYVDLAIEVYGVPPWRYLVSARGLSWLLKEVEYPGFLKIAITAQAPPGELLPVNTLIEITVEELNLKILVPIPP